MAQLETCGALGTASSAGSTVTVRCIRVETSGRNHVAVDLPTMAESGLPGYEVNQWYGVTTSAKVPTSIVLKLNSAINDVLRAPDVVQRLTADGSEIVGGTPEAFGAYIRADIARWSKLITEAHLTLR